MSTREQLLLLVVLARAPASVGLAILSLSFQRTERVSYCADCHTVTPWIADLHEPKSKSLASLHYRNRWIVHDKCYTCHPNYGFLGPIKIKLVNMKQVAIYYSCIGMPRQITLSKPFPNGNCLQPHGSAASFQNNPAHASMIKAIMVNQLSCITCYQPIHVPEG